MIVSIPFIISQNGNYSALTLGNFLNEKKTAAT